MFLNSNSFDKYQYHYIEYFISNLKQNTKLNEDVGVEC